MYCRIYVEDCDYFPPARCAVCQPRPLTKFDFAGTHTIWLLPVLPDIPMRLGIDPPKRTLLSSQWMCSRSLETWAAASIHCFLHTLFAHLHNGQPQALLTFEGCRWPL